MLRDRAASRYDAEVTRRREPAEFVENFRALKKAITAMVTEAYAVAEVTSMQARFVRYIGEHPSCSQAEVARAVELDPTLTGRTVQGLLDRELVRRARSEQDRREYVLELTTAGKRMRDRVEKLRTQFTRRIFEALDDRDLDDFARITQKILAAP